MQAFFFRCFHPGILNSTCKRPHYSIPIFKTQDGGGISQICFLYFIEFDRSSAICIFYSLLLQMELFYFNGNGCFLTTSVFCFCCDLNRSLLLSDYLTLSCYLCNLRITGGPCHFFTDSLCWSQLCF